MGKYRGMMIVSDCDGTLLNSRREIPERNLKAIRHFVGEGGRFVIATGRPRNGARHIVDSLSLGETLGIYFNGALIYDGAKKQPLYMDELKVDISAVLKSIQHQFPQVGLEAFTLDQAFIIQDHPITRYHFQILRETPVFSTAEQAPRRGVLKLFATGENSVLRKVQAYLMECFPNMFNAVLSGDTFLEIFSLSSSKGNAVKELRRRYPEVRLLCAVGDNYNDIPMFREADRAFIPADGVEAAKKWGTPVCSCDDGAIADVISLLGNMVQSDWPDLSSSACPAI